jgi:hypothetical protein
MPFYHLKSNVETLLTLSELSSVGFYYNYANCTVPSCIESSAVSDLSTKDVQSQLDQVCNQSWLLLPIPRSCLSQLAFTSRLVHESLETLGFEWDELWCECLFTSWSPILTRWQDTLARKRSDYLKAICQGSPSPLGCSTPRYPSSVVVCRWHSLV